MDPSPDLALYVRLISGMILGLAVARLFVGIAELVQYSERYRPDLVHVLWLVIVLVDIVLFWWNEAQTFGTVSWTFPLYLFQIAYCCSYFLLVALLLPEQGPGEKGHGWFFLAKRRWFFGTLILAYAMGAANTVLKERDLSIVTEDLWIDAGLIALFALAGYSASRRLHLAVAIPVALVAVLGLVIETMGAL